VEYLGIFKMSTDLMVNQMQVYLAKQRYIQAVQIDNEWLKFLTSEMGFSEAKKGDYYVRQNNGVYVIFAKQNFENLFELESNALPFINFVNGQSNG
jgi:hypothetical protein